MGVLKIKSYFSASKKTGKHEKKLTNDGLLVREKMERVAGVGFFVSPAVAGLFWGGGMRGWGEGVTLKIS